MFSYLLRRILYAIPILLGVNLITFCLFFMVNTPEDMARAHLGQKYLTPSVLAHWQAEHGYDKPLFWASNQTGFAKIAETLFIQKTVDLFTFNFGRSDASRDISHDISQRMWPSLAIAVPTLVLGVVINIFCAMVIAFFRSTYIDLWGGIVCVVMMSISGLFYIIGGQFFFGKMMQLAPVSGYQPDGAGLKFLILPVAIGVLSGIGAGTRWYRTIFLEEMHKDYVRTARAKGLGDGIILFRHVLKNAMIPILTGIVVIIPALFMGSLLMESFFSIPGLGSYTIDAIQQQDFAIVRVMVFLGTLLYILGLMLTDLCYALVDPRIRLQ